MTPKCRKAQANSGNFRTIQRGQARAVVRLVNVTIRPSPALAGVRDGDRRAWEISSEVEADRRDQARAQAYEDFEMLVRAGG
jgi:hypothetical protein